jgi:hypothetical protein
VPLVATLHSGAARQGEPTRFGLPLPRGLCRDGHPVRLRSEAGHDVPLQCRVLDRWPDGSIRWLRLDALVTASEPATPMTLEVGGVPRSEPAPRVVVTSPDDTSGLVDTGPAQFAVRVGGAGWFEGVRHRGVDAIDASQSRFEVLDESGRAMTVVVRQLTWNDTGPIRAEAVLDGEVIGPGGVRLVLQVRLGFFAGLSTVRQEITIRNPRRAEHAGGYWELGDPGSVRLGAASIVVTSPAAARLRDIDCWIEPEGGSVSATTRLHLHQESSGLQNWQSSNHVTSSGDLSVRFAGYVLDRDGVTAPGGQATPSVRLRHDRGELGLAMPRFWENFPKAVRAGADGLGLELFPATSGRTYELQGGEQKTHVVYVAYGDDPVSTIPLDWVRRPIRIAATPDWYCGTQAVKYLIPAASDPHVAHLEIIQNAIAGPHSFVAKRAVIDEYGWRHFGDLYGDHEAVRRSATDPPLVSHYNNQYDPIAGFARQFLRTADWRWWTLMDDLAAHVTDIDIYHTDGDKAAYNHGLFWHTDHYQDASKATHRTFPRAPGVRGGGPSPDHNYATGLTLHYYLTGTPQSRDAALGLARWVVAIDDGRRTPFAWLDSGPTGIVSLVGGLREHGPGRAGGNSVSALIDAEQLSGDRAFLRKAEELIRRCIHPADDIEARDLLDAERRWYYTVFLQALGKYLDRKADGGELDVMYAYGRQSLLAYARWMTANERPYLDHPERLEYPTETWVAQELRKSDVFEYAARHASAVDRAAFRERSQFFFDYAVRTLQSMPTKTLTRPIVILLSNGLIRGWAMQERQLDAPVPDVPEPDFGAPERFVPQRIRAQQRAIWLGVAIGIVAAAGLAMSLR